MKIVNFLYAITRVLNDVAVLFNPGKWGRRVGNKIKGRSLNWFKFWR